MAVRPLKDGGYLADVFMGYRKDGSPWRNTKTCKTEKEAEYWENKFKIEKEVMKGKTPDGITLSDYLELVYWKKKAGLAESTKGTRRRVLRHDVLPILGDVPIHEITRDDVQTMINECSTKYTAQKAREELSSVLSFAFDGTDHANPCSSRHFIYPKKKGESRKGVILTTYDEHTKLQRYVHETAPGSALERIVVIGLCLGLRPEEALALDWGNVDLKKRTALIDQALQDEGGVHVKEIKTDNGLRNVPLSAYALSRMKEWYNPDERPCDNQGRDILNFEGKKACPVIRNSVGGRMSHYSARRVIRSLRGQTYGNGEPIPEFTQWSLRHSFGTAAIVDAKMDENLLKELMGHADVTTTRRLYVKPVYKNVEDAIKLMDGFYGDL